MTKKVRQANAWNTPTLSKEGQRQLKRQALIREAGRAFRGKAFHDTTMNDIAKALNVSKGALYYYVANKQELLYECHKLAMEIGDAAWNQAEQEGNNGLDVFALFIRYYIQQVTEDLGSSAMLAEISALKSEQQAEIIQLRDQQEQRYRATIERGIEDGSIRHSNPKLATFFVIGAINWMTKWYNEGGEYSGEEIAEQFAELVQYGLSRSTTP